MTEIFSDAEIQELSVEIDRQLQELRPNRLAKNVNLARRLQQIDRPQTFKRRDFTLSQPSYPSNVRTFINAIPQSGRYANGSKHIQTFPCWHVPQSNRAIKTRTCHKCSIGFSSGQ